MVKCTKQNLDNPHFHYGHWTKYVSYFYLIIFQFITYEVELIVLKRLAILSLPAIDVVVQI